MKTIIDTDRYVRSHARMPKGRGLWLFDMGLSCEQRGYTALPQFAFNGTYQEAKAAAKAAGEVEASMIGGKLTLIVTVCD